VHQVRAVLKALGQDGRWRRPLALAIVFAIGCGLLSWWQWARYRETAEANALVIANYSATPRPLTDVLHSLTAYRADQQWTQVTVTGRYLPAEELLVRNRTNDIGDTSDGDSDGDEAGFELLVPLLLPDGDVFVVDRGFLPVGSTQDRPDVVPDPASGSVTVVARLQADEGPIPGRTAPAGEIPSIDLKAVAQHVGRPTYTAAYGLMVDETPPAATDPQQLAPPTFSDDEGMHVSYAIQWIAFAVIAFTALFWSVRRSLSDAGDPDVLEAEIRAETRRAARAPSDESVEDALLER